MIHFHTKIILASASPRRRALLRSAGVRFTVSGSRLDEDRYTSLHGQREPSELAVSLACAKARDAGLRTRGDRVIVAADTVVVMGDKVIGKPRDKRHARRILRLLSGKTHTVITGVCLLEMPEGTSHSFSVATNVTMLPMTDADIRWYIGTGEPMDKAGAYGIQGLGGLFVGKISGSYTNVVGLPLAELFEALRGLGAIEITA
ncbi:MAG: Maf family protein [Deltaproteobacteria bacterium]|nr:Maf family protein [Deltaproteobacteria bacterium]MCL5278272.1 Maf family protein [Deltaproteobacteria bacterium]